MFRTGGHRTAHAEHYLDYLLPASRYGQSGVHESPQAHSYLLFLIDLFGFGGHFVILFNFCLEYMPLLGDVQWS
jgi:hypothetical protein